MGGNKQIDEKLFVPSTFPIQSVRLCVIGMHSCIWHMANMCYKMDLGSFNSLRNGIE